VSTLIKQQEQQQRCGTLLALTHPPSLLSLCCSTEGIEERVFECPASEDVMGFINMCKAHFTRTSAPRSTEEQQQWQKVRGTAAVRRAVWSVGSDSGAAATLPGYRRLSARTKTTT
jgi:hypothetical protein